MASSSAVKVLQQKKRRHQQHTSLFPSKQFHPHNQTIIQRRNDARHHQCSELLETVLETLSTSFKEQCWGSVDSPSRRNHFDNSSTMKGSASPALESYFHDMIMEMDLFDIDECRVVVDNAHIPLEYSESTSEKDNPRDFQERLSRSLSDLSFVSSPSGFLQEDSAHTCPSCRWESFNSSSSSGDFSLTVPRRTSDSDDEATSPRKPLEPTPPTPPFRGRRRNLAHALSLDSTARLLRHLPLETSSHSTSTQCSSTHLARSTARTRLSMRSSDEEIEDVPELSFFDQSSLKKLSEEELHPVFPSFCHGDSRKGNSVAGPEYPDVFTSDDDEDSLIESEDELIGAALSIARSARKSEEEQIAAALGIARSARKFSYDRWSVHSPKESLPKNTLALIKNVDETPTIDWSSKKPNFLARRSSPRILADFPLAPSFEASYNLSSDESMGEIFQNTTNILDRRTTCQYRG